MVRIALLIKEIPTDRVKDYTKYTIIYRNCMENALMQDPEVYAFKLIQMKIKDILENKKKSYS